MSERRTATGVLREEHQLILKVLAVLQQVVEGGQSGDWDVDAMEECVALIQRETRRLIRQQYNWFRLNDARIQWLDVAVPPYPYALELICERFEINDA